MNTRMEEPLRHAYTTRNVDQTESAIVDTFNLASEVVNLFRAQCDRELRFLVSGMTNTDAAVLMELEMYPGISQARLAKAVGTTQMTVVRLLDRLERLGWVRRASISTDRRAWAISLTAAGRLTIPKIRAGRRKVLKRIISVCGTIDPQVTRALSMIKESLLC
jgi:DNA-binding MarR family transcriptional regulator